MKQAVYPVILTGGTIPAVLEDDEYSHMRYRIGSDETAYKMCEAYNANAATIAGWHRVTCEACMLLRLQALAERGFDADVAHP